MESNLYESENFKHTSKQKSKYAKNIKVFMDIMAEKIITIILPRSDDSGTYSCKMKYI